MGKEEFIKYYRKKESELLYDTWAPIHKISNKHHRGAREKLNEQNIIWGYGGYIRYIILNGLKYPLTKTLYKEGYTLTNLGWDYVNDLYVNKQRIASDILQLLTKERKYSKYVEKIINYYIDEEDEDDKILKKYREDFKEAETNEYKVNIHDKYFNNMFIKKLENKDTNTKIGLYSKLVEVTERNIKKSLLLPKPKNTNVRLITIIYKTYEKNDGGINNVGYAYDENGNKLPYNNAYYSLFAIEILKPEINGVRQYSEIYVKKILYMFYLNIEFFNLYRQMISGYKIKIIENMNNSLNNELIPQRKNRDIDNIGSDLADIDGGADPEDPD